MREIESYTHDTIGGMHDIGADAESQLRTYFMANLQEGVVDEACSCKAVNGEACSGIEGKGINSSEIKVIEVEIIGLTIVVDSAGGYPTPCFHSPIAIEEMAVGKSCGEHRGGIHLTLASHFDTRNKCEGRRAFKEVDGTNDIALPQRLIPSSRMMRSVMK